MTTIKCNSDCLFNEDGVCNKKLIELSFYYSDTPGCNYYEQKRTYYCLNCFSYENIINENGKAICTECDDQYITGNTFEK